MVAGHCAAGPTLSRSHSTYPPRRAPPQSLLKSFKHIAAKKVKNKQEQVLRELGAQIQAQVR